MLKYEKYVGIILSKESQSYSMAINMARKKCLTVNDVMFKAGNFFGFEDERMRKDFKKYLEEK